METERDTNTQDFFVAGGTLRASAPSYVLRPADEELFQMASQGAFCYVLTPRQMGKSSLMIRTAKRLGEQGVRAGIVDLTQIGAKVTVEQWYLGLLSQLRRSLKLEADYAEWWAAHSALGEVQRFTDFLREVVLSEIKERVVIFIDEIDSTLRLDFRDDFFAAIRAMYNARAESPDFGRLSFVLLGVASPPDLIRDLTRTPFNIGQAIALKEFSRADTAVLQDELEVQFPGQGEAIFERIFYWTNGHPYLTQKLCQVIAERPQAEWSDTEVDKLVTQQFLIEEARKESNLENVQNNILSQPLKVPMLKLYRNVVRGGVISENQTPVQNQLKLSGLVKAEGGTLVVRNRVYGQVFDGDWVRANIPVNWTRRLAVAASASLVVLLGLFAFFFVESTILMPNRVRLATADFFQKPTSKDRIAALAAIIGSKGIFDVKSNDDSAIELFYALSWEDQFRLFDAYETHEVSDEELVTVIKALYVTLADVDGTGNNLKLLDNMVGSLERREKSDEAKKLRDEIRAWVDGALAEAKGDAVAAERAYNTTINLNASNPATRFTRGKFFAKTNRPADALNEFNEVILIAQRLAATAKSVEPTATITQPQTTASNTTVNVTQLTDVPPNTLTPSILPTALITITVAPVPTPLIPTATPRPNRFMAQFATASQMIVAVRDFVGDDLQLTSGLAASPITATVALRGVLSNLDPKLELAPGVTMQLVRVPAGNFLMGSDKTKDPNADDDELPQHTVFLSAYYIGKYEVTNAQWAAFAEATSRTFDNPSGKADHPVVNVSWDDAVAFTMWLSQKSGRTVHLPTEAQWEKAARGSGDGRIYPWGDAFDTTKANTSKAGKGDTTPVGSYSPQGDSPFGVADMSGNVWEWSQDWYDANAYKNRAGGQVNDPTGPASGDGRVVRGGSWVSYDLWVRSALRNWNGPQDRGDNLGFRVVVVSPLFP
jgi:formylglycine-generating enzyme required for sulfatase activity